MDSSLLQCVRCLCGVVAEAGLLLQVAIAGVSCVLSP